MKTIASICISLLAITVLLQVRILKRLDAISKRPIVAPSAHFPSAATIAAEIRSQMALEARLASPPSFGFQHRHSSTGNGQLTQAAFTLTCLGGFCASLTVAGPTATTSTLTRIENSEGGDRYELSFKPDQGPLPAAWTFALRYLDRSGVAQEQTFQVTYAADRQPGDQFAFRKQ